MRDSNNLEEVGWDELGLPLALAVIIALCVIIAGGLWAWEWIAWIVS